jgi:hypothetical protein
MTPSYLAAPDTFTIFMNYTGITTLILTFFVCFFKLLEGELDNIAEGIINAPVPLNLILEHLDRHCFLPDPMPQ